MTDPKTFTAHIRLPWPPKALWQNTRCHWSKRAAATAQARSDGHVLAIHAGLKAVAGEGYQHRLSFDFYPPDRRKRDVSNCIAACKAYIDGIADCLGLDDSTLKIAWPEEWGTVDKDGGSVLVVIRSARVAIAAERAGYDG